MLIVFLFLGIVAGSFAGNMEDITIHIECTNGIDDDNSAGSIDDGPSGTDLEDHDCFYYPMSDGNGELHTDPNVWYQSNREYPSLFEYHAQYGGPYVVCAGFSEGLYGFQNEMQQADDYLNAHLSPLERSLGNC